MKKVKNPSDKHAIVAYGAAVASLHKLPMIVVKESITPFCYGFHLTPLILDIHQNS